MKSSKQTLMHEWHNIEHFPGIWAKEFLWKIFRKCFTQKMEVVALKLFSDTETILGILEVTEHLLM